MNNPVLGQLLTGGEHRDAIHVAIAPVTAASKLWPGQDVGFVSESRETVGTGGEAPVGIVDPFLKHPVNPGERFYVFLYPQTITSLRHEWTHPSFDSPRISVEAHKVKSVEWVRAQAEAMGLSYDVLMENAWDWIHGSGDYAVQRGSERWRDSFNPVEFWHHYEVITGEVVPEDKKQSMYCCSC